ncbi:hypothetical protein PaeBR_13425 [Paenibacillus sp. BR2-3]|uniref:hypothetical protein n=1 Tax=Paenibacillus sp. BR2-3 TaxID=3048494 RepID=UPI003977BD87
MTTNSANDDNEQKRTDEAWARLQGKLANEPVSLIWSEWGKNTDQVKTEDLEEVAKECDSAIVDPPTGSVSLVEVQIPAVQNNKTGKRSSRRRMSRSRKWAAAAAGVAVFAAILSTPVGNTAMASFLNQFRMQNVTVVNEDDLRNIFNEVTENGDINESVNKFGAFTNTSGTLSGDMTLDKVADALGFAPPGSVAADAGNTAFVNPSQEITLSLNVGEVNNALKRLGAEKLLPESIDGKAITLQIPERVNYNLSPDNNHWSSLMQMNTPVITVDPSIKVEEALETIINFPLLPDYLKSSLKQSSVLSGEIPMPLIAGDHTEQISVGSTVVLMDRYEESQGSIYNATWVQNGQLFQFSGGNLYTNKEKFMAKLQELIQS